MDLYWCWKLLNHVHQSLIVESKLIKVIVSVYFNYQQEEIFSHVSGFSKMDLVNNKWHVINQLECNIL